MTSSTTHSAEIHAWLPEHADLAGLFDSTSQRIVATLAYALQGPGEGCYYEECGYTYVGKASITVSIGSRDQVVNGKVCALRAKKQAVLADAQVNVVKIEREIQTLLAITHEPRAEGGAS